MVVVLLVVGPERLPALAGQAGKWIGKAKRILESIRSDIESEIKSAELQDILKKQQSEIGELKDILKGTQKELEKEYDKGQDDGLMGAIEEQIESTRAQGPPSRPASQQHEAD